jgi:hypothetical protein
VGFGVGDLEVPVFLQLELRRDLELGLELQRLSVVEVDLCYVWIPHNVPVLLFGPPSERLRQQVVQHILPDLVLETGANNAERGLARSETRELGALLDTAEDVLCLALNLFERYSYLNFVLAAFNEGHCREDKVIIGRIRGFPYIVLHWFVPRRIGAQQA